MTRIPGAIWKPGPENKLGYAHLGVGKYDNIMAGIACHSLEGWRGNVMNQLNNPAAGSWPVTILTNGEIWQHYELEAVCYANGNVWANRRFVCIEHEGVAGQPLTAIQLEKSIFVAQFIANIPTAYPLVREPRSQRTLWEHNEIWNLATPNAGPTVCPSGRIPWDAYVDAAPAPPPAPTITYHYEIPQLPFLYQGTPPDVPWRHSWTLEVHGKKPQSEGAPRWIVKESDWIYENNEWVKRYVMEMEDWREEIR